MATTCEINEQQQTEKYPLYMVTKENMLVLFSADETGTVIKAGLKGAHAVGAHLHCLDMDNFRPLKGTFTAGNV